MELTPKEKAQELVNRFMFAGIYFTDGIDGARKNAKQCALIAVNAIIEVLYSLKFGNALQEELEYYDQVIHEIVNLK